MESGVFPLDDETRDDLIIGISAGLIAFVTTFLTLRMNKLREKKK